MKTYRAYTSEIEGYRDVAETVKVVERIAASRIHVLKEEVAALESYVSEIARRIARVSVFYNARNHPLLRARNEKGNAVVVLTSDTGLVGGLWHGLVNALLEKGSYRSVFVVGAKGVMYLREERVDIAASFPQIPDALPDSAIEEVTTRLFEQFTQGAFSRVDILYPKFFSLARQEPCIAQFLPFDFSGASRELGDPDPAKTKTEIGFPIFDPSKAAFFDRLLRKYIAVSFRRFVADMKLSELSARTIAMDNASEKTDELLRKLRLDFTKERHRFVTQKQLESFAAHAVR